MKQFKYLSVITLSTTFFLASLNLEAKAANLSLNTDDYPLVAQTNINDGTASDLFRRTYNNRYTWDDKFPGYTAVVEFKQGKNVRKGNVRVDSNLSVEVTGISDKEVEQTVKNQLLMLTVHRRSTPFEVAHKNKKFGFAENTNINNGVVEVVEKGKETQARYQIANNQIIQVQRKLGPHNVVVRTLDTEMTPEGYIATQYQSNFYEVKTNRLVGEEIYTDTYKKFGNYYLPVRQVIESTENGNKVEAEFNFSDVKLIQANNS